MTEAVRFRLTVPFSHKEASGGDEEVPGDEINRGPVATAERNNGSIIAIALCPSAVTVTHLDCKILEPKENQ
ncbi:hypothetical protein O988_08757 [Pseudogymnoascus sp. VKM F-3808]|nr:hypothetical protein O988_08757 [Pseudogymnoascus sp. VKM F-3808]